MWGNDMRGGAVPAIHGPRDSPPVPRRHDDRPFWENCRGTRAVGEAMCDKRYGKRRVKPTDPPRSRSGHHAAHCLFHPAYRMRAGAESRPTVLRPASSVPCPLPRSSPPGTAPVPDRPHPRERGRRRRGPRGYLAVVRRAGKGRRSRPARSLMRPFFLRTAASPSYFPAPPASRSSPPLPAFPGCRQPTGGAASTAVPRGYGCPLRSGRRATDLGRAAPQ